jgi:hypothetical protein
MPDVIYAGYARLLSSLGYQCQWHKQQRDIYCESLIFGLASKQGRGGNFYPAPSFALVLWHFPRAQFSSRRARALVAPPHRPETSWAEPSRNFPFLF